MKHGFSRIKKIQDAGYKTIGFFALLALVTFNVAQAEKTKLEAWATMHI